MTIQEFNNIGQTDKLAQVVKAKAIIKRSSGKIGGNIRKLAKLGDFYVVTYFTINDITFNASDNIEILLKEFYD